MFVGTGHLGVFGLGYDDLSAGLNHELTWRIAGLLLATKLVATVACYGLGGCGGIFSPTLFFGGMCGVCLAGLSSLIMPLTGPDQLALTVVGMSACLGAVVRAPVTGILIVFEMTHEFSLVPALMIGALVSETISRRMNRHNFYDALIRQDGHQIEHVKPPRDMQSWHQLPVSAIANFRPVLLNDLSPAELTKALKLQPYQRFPVVNERALVGILTRKEAESAMRKTVVMISRELEIIFRPIAERHVFVGVMRTDDVKDDERGNEAIGRGGKFQTSAGKEKNSGENNEQQIFQDPRLSIEWTDRGQCPKDKANAGQGPSNELFTAHKLCGKV